MSKRILGLLSLVLLLCAPLGRAEAQTGVTLTGEVRNGTAGGQVPGGLEVRLMLVRGDAVVDTLTTMADAAGAFRFADLKVQGEDAFILQGTYADVTYSAGPLPFTAGASEQTAVLPVYETTTDPSHVVVNRVHLFASPVEQALYVAELYVFANAGDRTYVGTGELNGQRWVSAFTLPAGSRDLVLDDGALGGRFLATAEGFVDREPLWPGSTSVMYRYVLDCPDGLCNLSRQITQPITSMNLLIPNAGVRVTSTHLLPQENVAAQDGVYSHYAATHLAPGQALDLTLNLGVGQAAPGGARPTWPWALAGVAAVAVALSYPFWRRKGLPGPETTERA